MSGALFGNIRKAYRQSNGIDHASEDRTTLLADIKKAHCEAKGIFKAIQEHDYIMTHAYYFASQNFNALDDLVRLEYAILNRPDDEKLELVSFDFVDIWMSTRQNDPF